MEWTGIQRHTEAQALASHRNAGRAKLMANMPRLLYPSYAADDLTRFLFSFLLFFFLSFLLSRSPIIPFYTYLPVFSAQMRLPTNTSHNLHFSINILNCRHHKKICFFFYKKTVQKKTLLFFLLLHIFPCFSTPQRPCLLHIYLFPWSSAPKSLPSPHL